MSHLTLAREGLEAVQQNRWDEAVTKLTTALKESQNPSWIEARSKALTGLGRYEDALRDAELGWHVAFERNSRADMMKCQYRRGIVYFRLRQYADADCCCFYAMRMAKGYPAFEDDDPKLPWLDERGHWTFGSQKMMDVSRTDPFNVGHRPPNVGDLPLMTQTQLPHVLAWRQYSILRLQILRALEALPEDDEARLVKVNQVPSRRPYDDMKMQLHDLQREKDRKKRIAARRQMANSAAAAAADDDDSAPEADTSAEPRMQEFQSRNTMTVSIFSKGIDESKLTVDFQLSSVRLDPVVYPDGTSRPLYISLWANIDPSSSKFSVTSRKVELRLSKETPGKWPQLTKAEEKPTVEAPEPSKSDVTAKDADNKDDNADNDGKDGKDDQDGKDGKDGKDGNQNQSSQSKTTQTTAPSYPTSSRSGPKDWDKIASGNGADEDDDPDVNAFFKKLYENATPEQRRAMMKSFTESNGTSLSTDWNDVKGRTVETVPPEGMEAKKYSE
ncbi:hypothetical protein CP532_5893 [Ophiocordyceps camponoti-leonardi (nom. inval.)]|nr:hypothetical protein CP532_5893 [Ophiocordyceps camponoti-leonardi (nom. inval.)]